MNKLLSFRRGLTSAAPRWSSQAGSSVLSSADAPKTRPLLNKRPVLLPMGLLKLEALSSLLLMPKRHNLHFTRGQCCSTWASSSLKLYPLFCWCLKDTASIVQEASALMTVLLKLGALSSLLLMPQRHGLHCTRGQCCSLRAFSSWELCPLFCWYPKDAAQVYKRQELLPDVFCWHATKAWDAVSIEQEARATPWGPRGDLDWSWRWKL